MKELRLGSFREFFPIFRERCQADAGVLGISLADDGGVDFRLARDVFTLRVLRQENGDIRTELLEGPNIIHTALYVVEEVNGALGFRVKDKESGIAYEDMPEAAVTTILTAKPLF